MHPRSEHVCVCDRFTSFGESERKFGNGFDLVEDFLGRWCSSEERGVFKDCLGNFFVMFYSSATLSASMLGQLTKSIRGKIHGDLESVESGGRVERPSS